MPRAVSSNWPDLSDDELLKLRLADLPLSLDGTVVATWIDQFGTSGCVGCGRCITWCPVGIDITEEVRAIGESEATHGAGHD